MTYIARIINNTSSTSNASTVGITNIIALASIPGIILYYESYSYY